MDTKSSDFLSFFSPSLLFGDGSGGDGVLLNSSGWLGTCYVDQAGLKLKSPIQVAGLQTCVPMLWLPASVLVDEVVLYKARRTKSV